MRLKKKVLLGSTIGRWSGNRAQEGPMMTSWFHFPCYCPFVKGIHRSPMCSLHIGPVIPSFGVSFFLYNWPEQTTGQTFESGWFETRYGYESDFHQMPSCWCEKSTLSVMVFIRNYADFDIQRVETGCINVCRDPAKVTGVFINYLLAYGTCDLIALDSRGWYWQRMISMINCN